MSPSFGPLVPVTGSGDHFPVEHVTSVIGTVGSKYDSLSPPPATTSSCQNPVGFLWTPADALSGLHQKASQSLSHFRCISHPRRYIFACKMNCLHFSVPFQESPTASPRSSVCKLRRDNAAQTIAAPGAHESCMQCHVSASEWGRMRVLCTSWLDRVVWSKWPFYFTLGRDPWNSLAADLWPGN